MKSRALIQKQKRLQKQSRKGATRSPQTQKRNSTQARSRQRSVDANPTREFLNRDLQWLEFNSRVLHEAIDSRTPLLERIKFLGIVTSNLDEFFMKRISRVRERGEELFLAIRAKVLAMQASQGRVFHSQLRKELAMNGIHLLKWSDLSDSDKIKAREYYRKNIFPVLTPLAVDPGHPFPFISSLSVSLGVTLKHPDQDEKLFARIKVPKMFSQWVDLSSNDPKTFRFVSLMEVIIHCLQDLFPDMTVVDVMPFRITRNVEVERDEEDADDLLEMVAEELKQRKFGEVVRLEHPPEPDQWMLRFLIDELGVSEADVYEVDGPLDFTDLAVVGKIPLDQLKYPAWTPLVPPRLALDSKSLFDEIRGGDLLVHHPFESFQASTEKFIRSAVDDPDVVAIKMTLYRTGDDSPFIPLLIRAAEIGKQVVVLIELKARFDEERNIFWAQELENAGVHVVYGVVGLKTHAKTALVIRNEADGLRCYTHLGTGNYHKETARLYTDFGYFTARPEITEDVVELFHFLTGRSLKRKYLKLLVAPVDMKTGILERIEREIQAAGRGKAARIVMKCNSLEEKDISRALYRASQAGVEVELFVRGFCCLRPGVKGMSERIRVHSVIGRFLEHSRIFHFSGGFEDPLKGEFWLGSADLMYRNLLGRVETLVPIEGQEERKQLWELIEILRADRRSSWRMHSDGSYTQYAPRTESEGLGTHQALMAATRARHTRDLRVLTDQERESVRGGGEIGDLSSLSISGPQSGDHLQGTRPNKAESGSK